MKYWKFDETLEDADYQTLYTEERPEGIKNLENEEHFESSRYSSSGR